MVRAAGVARAGQLGAEAASCPHVLHKWTMIGGSCDDTWSAEQLCYRRLEVQTRSELADPLRAQPELVPKSAFPKRCQLELQSGPEFVPRLAGKETQRRPKVRAVPIPV